MLKWPAVFASSSQSHVLLYKEPAYLAREMKWRGSDTEQERIPAETAFSCPCQGTGKWEKKSVWKWISQPHSFAPGVAMRLRNKPAN